MHFNLTMVFFCPSQDKHFKLQSLKPKYLAINKSLNATLMELKQFLDCVKSTTWFYTLTPY